MNIVTLITTEELGKRICYSPRYIRRQLVDYKLIEGVHYTRPFGTDKLTSRHSISGPYRL